MVYSGLDITDRQGRGIVDIISQSVSESEIRQVLAECQSQTVGTVRFSLDISARPNNVDILTASHIPTGFDGWVYANGVTKLGKNLFPEAYRLFSSISNYPGKINNADWFVVPKIDRFIKLDPSDTGIPYLQQDSQYSMPSHTHSLSCDATTSTHRQTVRRAAYIWATSGANNDGTGGIMPAIATYTGYKCTLNNIPCAPSAHHGGKSRTDYNEKGKATGTSYGTFSILNWDVPIDTTFNSNSTPFKCDTGVAGQAAGQCYPSYWAVPVLIFVGRPV